MFSMNNAVVSVFLLFSVINYVLPKQIPSYISLCKREQSTIDACVRETVEKLRPKLAEGIPELDVPPLDPFFIKEIKPNTGDLAQLRALGKDVKVTGAGNFSIKSVSVDIDTFTIKARVRFPKLHFVGRYELDARFLVVPLHGQGNLVADAIKCDADLVLYSQPTELNGKEYLKFTKLDVDVNVKDYRIRLEGLFNGDKTLGDAANEAINQNRADFFKSTKPYLEKTVSKILLDIANKIVDGVALDDVLPKP